MVFTYGCYDVGVEEPSGEIFSAAVKSLEETLDGRHAEWKAEHFNKLCGGDDLRTTLGARRAGWYGMIGSRKRYEEVFTSSGRGLRVLR